MTRENAGNRKSVAPLPANTPRPALSANLGSQFDYLAYLVAPALTLVLAVLVTQHFVWINGAPYWRWAWRQLEWTRALPVTLLGLIPFALGQLAFERAPARAGRALAAVTVSAFALQLLLLGIASTPFSLARMSGIIRSADASSYFTDAQAVGRSADLLARYPQILPKLHSHSLTKPPGPVLTYTALLAIFPDPEMAAQAGGVLIALAAAMCVPMVYGFVIGLGAKPAAGFHAASLLALTPSVQLFFPMLDQFYPHLSCGLLVTWLLALRRDDLRLAAGFGVILAVVSFFVYNLLVVGVALGAISAMMVMQAPRRSPSRLAQHVAVALGVFAGLYGVLWMVTGFDPIATFSAALANQQKLLRHTHRPYPDTVLFDLLEFAQGAGYLPVFLMIQYVCLRDDIVERVQRVLAFVFIGQIVTVALTGVLPGETERVWLFLVPLVVYGAGLELCRWPARWRALAYASLGAVLSAVHVNIGFV